MNGDAPSSAVMSVRKLSHSDLPNTPDSVFCSHGAGYTVKWHEVPSMAHVAIDSGRLRPWRDADGYLESR